MIKLAFTDLSHGILSLLDYILSPQGENETLHIEKLQSNLTNAFPCVGAWCMLKVFV